MIKTKYYYNIDMESGKAITLKDWYGSNYRQVAAFPKYEAVYGAAGAVEVVIQTGGESSGF